MKTDVSKDVILNNHSFKQIYYLLNKHMLMRIHGEKYNKKPRKQAQNTNKALKKSKNDRKEKQTSEKCVYLRRV